MTMLDDRSLERVWVPIRSEHPIDGDEDITTATVELAFVLAGEEPQEGDWTVAEWEAATKTIGGRAYYLAHILVGPGGGAVELAPRTIYDIHARLTHADLAPVIRCGRLTVY